jgi:hypothetical protein
VNPKYVDNELQQHAPQGCIQHKNGLENEQREDTATDLAPEPNLYRHIAFDYAVSRGDEHVNGLGLGCVASQRSPKKCCIVPSYNVSAMGNTFIQIRCVRLYMGGKIYFVRCCRTVLSHRSIIAVKLHFDNIT